MKMQWILLAAAAATLAGCATTPARTAADYICDRSGPISVAYNGDTAMVRTSEGMFRLPAMRTAWGAAYSDGQHQWRTRGGTGLWSIGRMAPDRCRPARQPR
jgi:membrane-bound inhibitor of C-type lysozyme